MRFATTIAACLLASSPAAGEVVTLQAARARALEQQPRLAMAQARVDAAVARAEAVHATARPNVYGVMEVFAAPGGEIVEVQDVDGTPIAVQGARTLGQGLSAFRPNPWVSALVGTTWNLYDFGRAAAAERAARAERRAREAEAAQTRGALLDSVDAAYLHWLAATEQVKLHDRAYEALVARRASVAAKVAAGALSGATLLELDTDLAAAELRTAYSEQAEAHARLAMAAAIGPLGPDARPDPALLDLAAGSESVDPPAEDPTLAARREAVQAEVELHDRAGLPRLEASAQLGVRTQLEEVFPLYRGTLQLTFPFWDGGASAARTDEARAKARALDAQGAAVSKERRAEGARNRVDQAQAERRIKLARRFVDLARGRLEDARARFEEDAATGDEVARAREVLGRAEAELLTARVDRVAALLRRARW